MKEKKERVVCGIIVLLFLLVILGFYGARRYDRTFYACGPADFFSLDRGRYQITVVTQEAAADSCRIYYEVNGQERVLASAGVKAGTGAVFETKLPSNIRNNSIRAVLLTGTGEELPQIDTLWITRVLPTGQTAAYLVIYLLVVLFLYYEVNSEGIYPLKGREDCGAHSSPRSGSREVNSEGIYLLICISVAFLPLYSVFCKAPVRVSVLIMTAMSLLLWAERKAGISRRSIVRYVFFLALSLTALYFASESSSFYARNPWDDVSIYYSIGRGITQGYVPYRDMFDHKGPVVFFLFALGHLLVPDCFYGVYLLESLCFSGVLYFAHKIYRLYFDEGAALVLSVLSMVILLDGGFLGYGASCEEFTMVIYMAVLYGYLAYFSGGKERSVWWMTGAGILSGLSFWMKFNMTVCLFVLLGMMVLYKLTKRQNILKDMAALAGGFIGVSVLVVGWFILADSIGYLKNGYFDANLAYADVKTTGEMLAVFGQNVLIAVKDNPGTTLLVVLGLLGFVLSARYMKAVIGRIGLLMAFAVLIGSTYISYAFLYYYCLVAVFAVLGVTVSASVLVDRIGKGKVQEWAGFALAVPCLCLLFVFNQNYREAAVFSENFTLCDVCEKEMEHDAKGQDKTVLMYRNHRVQMMTFENVRPAARYYFAPNISKHVTEINEEQDRYIHEGTADFVVVDHAEIYPSLMEWGLYQYDQLLDWKLEGESVQLYRRKAE